MAKATKHTTVTLVTLDLTESEARTLVTLLGAWVVGSNCPGSPRNDTDAIWDALRGAGVASDRSIINTTGGRVWLERTDVPRG
jgi:hypothetical protein